jgi:hypothetical protein
VPPILPPVDGFLFVDKTKFRASFLGDLPEAQARFMADSQVPWGTDLLAGAHPPGAPSRVGTSSRPKTG